MEFVESLNLDMEIEMITFLGLMLQICKDKGGDNRQILDFKEGFGEDTKYEFKFRLALNSFSQVLHDYILNHVRKKHPNNKKRQNILSQLGITFNETSGMNKRIEIPKNIEKRLESLIQKKQSPRYPERNEDYCHDHVTRTYVIAGFQNLEIEFIKLWRCSEINQQMKKQCFNRFFVHVVKEVGHQNEDLWKESFLGQTT